MKVKILCEFEVTCDDEDELSEDVAKAAEQAAYDYLSFVEISGRSTDVESVTVHVDGFGKCTVSIGEEHGGDDEE